MKRKCKSKTYGCIGVCGIHINYKGSWWVVIIHSCTQCRRNNDWGIGVLQDVYGHWGIGLVIWIRVVVSFQKQLKQIKKSSFRKKKLTYVCHHHGYFLGYYFNLSFSKSIWFSILLNTANLQYIINFWHFLCK